MRIALKKLPSAPIPAGPPPVQPLPEAIPVSAPSVAAPQADDISNLLGTPQPPPTTLLPLPPQPGVRPG
jgi:hypothetical protein